MIVCIIGTRPEAVKMAPVVKALRAMKQQVRLVSTGQHTTLLDQALQYFKLKPNLRLNLMQPNQTPLDILERVLHRLPAVFNKYKPDAVLAQGDTITVAATAMACFHSRIPFGHVEAGLRTHDLTQPWPEEWNRRVAAIGAKWHFAPTEWAGTNLLNEGVLPKDIYITGNTIVDALKYILAVKPIQPELPGVERRPYVLITCHRRENFGGPMELIFRTLGVYAKEHPELDFVYPVHPNPAVQLAVVNTLTNLPNVKLVPPMDYMTFIHALWHAQVIVSDSGGVQEEAPSLGKHVIVLREVTERPEGILAGMCHLVGADPSKLIMALDEYKNVTRDPLTVSPYGDGLAASRIAEIVCKHVNVEEMYDNGTQQ